MGPRTGVVPFFESMGFRCPERKAVPDFLQEVNSIKDQAVRISPGSTHAVKLQWKARKCAAGICSATGHDCTKLIMRSPSCSSDACCDHVLQTHMQLHTRDRHQHKVEADSNVLCSNTG